VSGKHKGKTVKARAKKLNQSIKVKSQDTKKKSTKVSGKAKVQNFKAKGKASTDKSVKKSSLAKPKTTKAKPARLESGKTITKLVRKKIPKNRWVDGEREPIKYACSRCKKHVELFLTARVVCSKCGNILKTPES
jgi:hypothetical protein